MRTREGFRTAFTRDLVEIELGPLDDAVAERAVAWVGHRFATAGDVTRLGLRSTGFLIGGLVFLATGRPYASLPDARRRSIARRLAATQLPLFGEYVKAVRSLATSHVFEARFASGAP